jgi:hypothetical protein
MDERLSDLVEAKRAHLPAYGVRDGAFSGLERLLSLPLPLFSSPSPTFLF